MTDCLLPLPATLQALAGEIRGKSWEAAKRVVVAKTGSIGPYERFDDDLADAVFARVQRNAQVGRWTDEAEIFRLGRGARRLEGEGRMTVYRAAPRGGGIRPGDFAAGSAHEAGFYRHGGHVVQKAVVERRDLIAVDGSMGDGQEYIYLPEGYKAPEPVVFFQDFRGFYDAAHGRAPTPEPAAPDTDEDADTDSPEP